MDDKKEKPFALIREPIELEYILSKLNEGCYNESIAISALRIANALERIADSHEHVHGNNK